MASIAVPSSIKQSGLAIVTALTMRWVGFFVLLACVGHPPCPRRAASTAGGRAQAAWIWTEGRVPALAQPAP